MGNWLEDKFKELKTAAGFIVLRRGWPDFLLISPDKKITAAEIKSSFDVVRPDQIAMHAALSRVGLGTEILYERDIFKLDHQRTGDESEVNRWIKRSWLEYQIKKREERRNLAL